MRILLLAMAASFTIGCGANDFREIPAGYVGKVLTPTGWQSEIREAGQVDIQRKNTDGSYNTLVLLEATSTAVKESFATSNADKEDHRILIAKTPVSVDVYIRLVVPAEDQLRNAIFKQITPVSSGDRISAITVSKIYDQFAKMDVRSGTRAVLQKYTDVYWITTNLDSVNLKLGAMVVETFKKNGVPLLVQNVTISNIKMDESIWAAENQKAAALSQVEAINKIGSALRANPEYVIFKKYDTYKELANSGKVGNFTIIEGNPNGIVLK